MTSSGMRVPSPKKSSWLDVTGIVVAATFVKRDEDRSALPQFLVGLNALHDFLNEPFEQVKFRGCRMAIHESARLND